MSKKFFNIIFILGLFSLSISDVKSSNCRSCFTAALSVGGCYLNCISSIHSCSNSCTTCVDTYFAGYCSDCYMCERDNDCSICWGNTGRASLAQQMKEHALKQKQIKEHPSKHAQ